MIKGKKGLIISLALIVLLAAATFVVLGINKGDNNKVTDNNKDAYVIVSEAAETLSSVKVESETVNLEAVNSGDSDWTITGFDNGEVSSAKAYELVGTVSNLTSKNKYDNPKDLSEYGLSEPKTTVTLTKKDGGKIKLYIGSLSPTLGEYFVMREGDSSVYTVYSYKVEVILRPVSYYTDFNRLKIEPADISGIKIERPADTIELRVRKDIDKYSPVVWEMLSPYKSAANDDYIDNKLIEPLSKIEITTPIEDADGGFKEKDTRLMLTITPFDNVTGKYGAEKSEILEIGASVGNETYVRYDGRVYKVPTEDISFVDDTAFNIVSKMQLLVNIAKVKTVTLEYGNNIHKLDISKSGDNKYSFKLDDKSADTAATQAIYESLISISADNVYTGIETGETVLKITYDCIDDSDDTVIEIKKTGDLRCAIERNGKIDFTMKNSKVTEFTEAFEKYVQDNQ